MYAVGTVIFYGPAVNRVLRRRSDGHLRPVVIAAGGITGVAAAFLALRALCHRHPRQGAAMLGLLPPRCSPEQIPTSTSAPAGDYELAGEAGAPLS
ncbi:hypothetical protein GCM10018781_76490 [Kitasatospora indigofera]|uniref:Uncharacterized protein n=1 Tax=Kitasatospora indigofera TaxID=67307 RepID=A0A918YUF0_9ACTN|nr:hypothetical protein [Kitasatospora indigofera]GHE25271.1 hypothetical protein GCM10018781_76490 [Kitasatospora indigofera]